MNKKRKQVIEQNEISELLTLSLGGYEQKVLLEGRSSELPIVITLHGGPGSPIPLSVGCRGLFPDFTNHFLMVYWDQLGSGINDRVIDDNFHISHFVDMTIDLIHSLKERFPQNKIVIFAASWGSVLCLRTVDLLKNEIDAAVVCGQIVKNPIYNDATFHTLENIKMSSSKEHRLQEVKSKSVCTESIKFLAGCINKYTDGYFNKKGPKMPMGSMMLDLISSPDYRLKDVKAIILNGTMKNQSLWKELAVIDMTDILTAVSIPYYIIQGDTDIVTDTQTVIEIADRAQNELLHTRVVKHTGHIPGLEAMNVILETLKACVK